MRRALTPLLITLSALVPATARATFPGASGEIAFTREQSDTIFAVTPGGAEAQVSDFTGDEPVFSPNGKQIAFTHFDGSKNGVWVMGADGTNPHEISTSDGFSEEPSWSPDGIHIVFHTDFDTGNGLYIGVADGSSPPVHIPGTDAHDQFPAWSPDGTRIAFIRGDLGAHQLWVMQPDGSGQKMLDASGDPMQDDSNPAWSPDGRTIYFDRERPPPGCSGNGHVFMIDANGGTPVPAVVDPAGVSDYLPAPSPDGTQLAYSRCDDAINDVVHIYVTTPGGGPGTPVTSAPSVNDYGPDWQPAAPHFSSPPTVSGSAVNGQTLTASAGAVVGGGSTTLQFERCDASGGGCGPIPGAAATRVRAAASTVSYTLTTSDIGHAIRVRQTTTNNAGPNSIESAPTTSVRPNPKRCSNVFVGTAKSESIRGTSGGDRISGGRGNDKLFGLGGADCLNGGSGKDFISGGRGNDTLIGGTGNDKIFAGPGRNKVSAGSGNDFINVRNHRRDVVNCGKGRDRVIADRVDKLRGCERVTRRR